MSPAFVNEAGLFLFLFVRPLRTRQAYRRDNPDKITIRSSGFVRQTYGRDNPDENNLRICNPLCKNHTRITNPREINFRISIRYFLRTNPKKP